MTTPAKKVCIALCALVACIGVTGFTGCRTDYFPEYESGYFRYAVETEKDGTQKAYLVGLTESGLEQTALVYPEELDGIPVYGIGYNKLLYPGYESVGMLASINLKKLYFPHYPEAVIDQTVTNTENAFAVYWDNKSKNRRPFAKAAIYGYNYYLTWIKGTAVYNSNNFIANLSYLYNYENALNDGYYWADSYDESVIDFIPPAPQREGYSFGGWFKEPECINEWDFETDKTGKAIVLKESKVSNIETYEGINLYAKWVKK